MTSGIPPVLRNGAKGLDASNSSCEPLVKHLLASLHWLRGRATRRCVSVGSCCSTLSAKNCQQQNALNACRQTNFTSNWSSSILLRPRQQPHQTRIRLRQVTRCAAQILAASSRVRYSNSLRDDGQTQGRAVPYGAATPYCWSQESLKVSSSCHNANEEKTHCDPLLCARYGQNIRSKLSTQLSRKYRKLAWTVPCAVRYCLRSGR